MNAFFRNPFKNKSDLIDVVIIWLLSTFMLAMIFYTKLPGYPLVAFIGICACYIDLFVANKIVRTACLAILLVLILVGLFSNIHCT